MFNISIPKINRNRPNPWQRLNNMKSYFNLYNPYRVTKQEKYLNKRDLGYISLLESTKRRKTA